MERLSHHHSQRSDQDMYASMIGPQHVSNGAANRPIKVDINKYPPFLNLAAESRTCSYGVVNLNNIPYSVTSQEIKLFLHRLCPTLSPIPIHTHGYPIHVLIERPTGKTMDCYVEFLRQSDAARIVLEAQKPTSKHAAHKIAQRHIQVELSSQAALMRALFPRAKNVEWDTVTGKPEILPNSDPYSEGFRGFFTIEEMASIVKHAVCPQRSPFSFRSMQRCYENMISTVYKFPWSSTANYTVAARDYLFTTYMSQLTVLASKVTPPGGSALVLYNSALNADATVSTEREVGLSHTLLLDFVLAGLNCPAFSLRQKFNITANCGSVGLGFPLTPLAFSWPFQTISAPFGASDTVLSFWLNILSDGFDYMAANDDHHAHESDIVVERDSNGFVHFDFKEGRQSMNFKEANEIETSVMEYIVEKGRMKWCLKHDLAYQPLAVIASFAKEMDAQLAIAMQEMQLDSDSSRSGMMLSAVMKHQSLSSDASSSGGVNIASSDVDNDEHDRPANDREQPELKRDSNQVASHIDQKDFTIDPRTPAFIPSVAGADLSTSLWTTRHRQQQQQLQLQQLQQKQPPPPPQQRYQNPRSGPITTLREPTAVYGPNFKFHHGQPHPRSIWEPVPHPFIPSGGFGRPNGSFGRGQHHHHNNNGYDHNHGYGHREGRRFGHMGADADYVVMRVNPQMNWPQHHSHHHSFRHSPCGTPVLPPLRNRAHVLTDEDGNAWR